MNIWSLIQRAQWRISRFIKRLADYSYYRDLGQSVPEAWEKSGRTL
ncbi:MAG: hypothetical protein WC710_14680 [Gallionella sp.]|jgi:hypothetical protein